MSEVQKQKQHPIPLRLEAQLKAKTLRSQPGSMMGALATPSRVKMNAKDGALDYVSSADAFVRSFTLDSGRCRHTQDDRVWRVSKN